MEVITVFTLGISTCLWNIQTAVGDYDVTVRLLEYNRDQDCGCDTKILFWKCYECDVFFQICLQPLSPTQRPICRGNNSDYRVDDTHHFLFANVPKMQGHDTYSWNSVSGQPTFEISVHAFDYDSGWRYDDDDDDLGVTSYTHRGNTPTVQNVTTTPGNKNLRIKLELAVSYSNNTSLGIESAVTQDMSHGYTSMTTSEKQPQYTTPMRVVMTPDKTTLTTTIPRKYFTTTDKTTLTATIPRTYFTTTDKTTLTTTIPRKYFTTTDKTTLTATIPRTYFTTTDKTTLTTTISRKYFTTPDKATLTATIPRKYFTTTDKTTLTATIPRTYFTTTDKTTLTATIPRTYFTTTDKTTLTTTIPKKYFTTPDKARLTTTIPRKYFTTPDKTTLTTTIPRTYFTTTDKTTLTTTIPRTYFTTTDKTTLTTTIPRKYFTTTDKTTLTTTIPRRYFTTPDKATLTTTIPRTYCTTTDKTTLTTTIPRKYFTTTDKTTLTTTIPRTYFMTPDKTTLTATIPRTYFMTTDKTTLTTTIPRTYFMTPDKTTLTATIPRRYFTTPQTTTTTTTFTTTSLKRVVTTPIKTTSTAITTSIPTITRNQSVIVLGSVSSGQIQRLEQEIKECLRKQYPRNKAAQSLRISDPVHLLNITSGKFVTKLLYTYSCTVCDLEDDQVKDSVEAALQSMNLTQYHGKTNTGTHPVKTSKVSVGLIVGLGISVLFIIVMVCAILWWYKRKLQHRSKIHAEGHRNTETEDRKPSDDTRLKQEELCPQRNDNRSNC